MSITDLGIVRRSLTGRPFLSVTTILTVAIAVCLLLTMLEVKDAGFRTLRQGGGDMHLLVSRDDSALVSVLNGVFFANAPRRSMAWTDYEEIASRYPLAYAIPTLLGDAFRGLPVMATTTDFFTSYAPHPTDDSGWALVDGRVFDGNWQVVLGSMAARQTGLTVGDTIHLSHGMPGQSAAPSPAAGSSDSHDHGHHHHHHHVHDEFSFEIVGILAPTGTPCDRVLFTTLESSWVVHAHDRRHHADPSIHETTEDDLTPEDRLITGIYVRVATREGSLLSGGMQQVFDDLRRDPTLTVAQPAQQIRALFGVIGGVEQLFAALIGIVMLGSGIAVALALYNSTEHRRRQIAMFRVLGFSRGRIVRLVLTESAMLGMLGGLLGVALSIGVIHLAAEALRTRFGLDIQPALLSRWIPVVLSAAIGIAVAAGIIPAAVAYRIPVVRHLMPLG